MNKLQRLLGLLPILIPLWLISRFVDSYSTNLVRLLAGACAVNAAIVWTLRFHRNYLVTIAKIPGFKQYIRLVCRLTGEQFPVGYAQNDAHQGLALRTFDDYEAAIAEAKLWVRGQSNAIEKYLRHVRDTVILRQQLTTKGDERPLACLFLSGASGIGKRYLARVLGRLIFLDGADQVWEMEKLGSDQVTALFGARGAPGPLTASLSRQPFQTIILENIECATGPMQDLLKSIMQQGVITDPASGRQMSFRNTILVMTTTRCVAELTRLSKEPLMETEWHSQAIEVVSGESGLASPMLACLNDFIVFDKLTPLTKAEVISLAMKRECSKYGVNLEFVAPELLMQEVIQIGDSDGFALVEDRTKKLLQRPLLDAAQKNKRRMVLKARPIN